MRLLPLLLVSLARGASRRREEINAHVADRNARVTAQTSGSDGREAFGPRSTGGSYGEGHRALVDRGPQDRDAAAAAGLAQREADHGRVHAGSLVFARIHAITDNENMDRGFREAVYEADLTISETEFEKRASLIGFMEFKQGGNIRVIDCYDRLGDKHMRVAFTLGVWDLEFGPSVAQEVREKRALKWCTVVEPDNVGGPSYSRSAMRYSKPGNELQMSLVDYTVSDWLWLRKGGWNKDCRRFDLKLVAKDWGGDFLRKLANTQLEGVPCLEGAPDGADLTSSRVEYGESSGSCNFKSGGREFAEIKASSVELGTFFCKKIDEFVHANPLIRQAVIGSVLGWLNSRTASKTDETDVSGTAPIQALFRSDLESVGDNCVVGPEFSVCPSKVSFQQTDCPNLIEVPIETAVGDIGKLAQALELHVPSIHIPCYREDEHKEALILWGFPGKAVWPNWVQHTNSDQTNRDQTVGDQTNGNEKFSCHGIVGSEYVGESIASQAGAEGHCAWVYVLKHWVSLIQHRASLSYEDPTTWGQ